jgi:hypothetical protein
MGYHSREIDKGVLSEPTKIIEEYEEWRDALALGNPVMGLIELTDMIGAIEAFTLKYYNINLEQLIVMTRATQSAFKDGTRK